MVGEHKIVPAHEPSPIVAAVTRTRSKKSLRLDDNNALTL